MDGLLEMQKWKAMMEAMMEPKNGIVGGGNTVGEGLFMERLQEMLLSLSALLQKLDRMLPAEGAQSRAPHGHDGLVLLSSVLLVAFSLAGIVYFLFFRGGEFFGGGAGGVAKVLKRPRGEGPLTMSEHECMFASIATLLFVILSLGGLYYYYCFQAGCFGGGSQHLVQMVASPGRKLGVV